MPEMVVEMAFLGPFYDRISAAVGIIKNSVPMYSGTERGYNTCFGPGMVVEVPCVGD